MSKLPGEEHAYWVLHSPITTATEKAEASVKLAQIAEIRQRNLQSDYEWRNGGAERYYNNLGKNK
jgi:hypothetical protein